MGGRTVHTAMWAFHNGAPLDQPTGTWRGGMALWNHPNSSTAIEAVSAKVWRYIAMAHILVAHILVPHILVAHILAVPAHSPMAPAHIPTSRAYTLAAPA